MTAYVYVFAVGNVLVKLFAMQGPQLPPNTLTAVDLLPIAQRIETLIRKIQGPGG